jgi:hypothetical protein
MRRRGHGYHRLRTVGGSFGLEFLTRFVEGKPLDQAVRGARLALLKRLNPLGLAYVPYGLGRFEVGFRIKVWSAGPFVQRAQLSLSEPHVSSTSTNVA